MTAEQKLVEDVRKHFSGSGTIREVKMFGGIAFMQNGHFAAAVSKRGLLLRLGKDQQADALAKPGVRPMEMRGRRMEGYVYVDPDSLNGQAALGAWLKAASQFVQTLPPKESARKTVRKGKST